MMVPHHVCTRVSGIVLGDCVKALKPLRQRLGVLWVDKKKARTHSLMTCRLRVSSPHETVRAHREPGPGLTPPLGKQKDDCDTVPYSIFRWNLGVNAGLVNVSHTRTYDDNTLHANFVRCWNHLSRLAIAHAYSHLYFTVIQGM